MTAIIMIFMFHFILMFYTHKKGTVWTKKQLALNRSESKRFIKKTKTFTKNDDSEMILDQIDCKNVEFTIQYCV